MNDIEYLKQRIAALEKRMEQIPSRFAGSSQVVFKSAFVIWGSQFYLPGGSPSGKYGLVYLATTATRTTVPTAAPTGHLASTLDGLAWTNLGWVIVSKFNDSAGNFHSAVQMSVPEGQILLVVASPVKMNNDTGGTSDVYMGYSL